MADQRNLKYIPLNADESAVLQDANTLLPRDEIYKPLAKWIEEAVERADIAEGKPLNQYRTHNAISLDGSRGTGKTAVLVNLRDYIKSEHPQLLKSVHILEPIDPTLLEDGESLFLHIIVASVLHDNEIKSAQSANLSLAKELNQALDKIAHALEVVETKDDRHGLDKVRAMYGNKDLADAVHTFFHTAVKLLNKKLLVLPIDDVDTSLNLAFENLEIIRRYLTTPHVLPIVSGDRALYHEVTWRDFHGRLTKDSSYQKLDAFKVAIELAEEYQRKVLPFPRRQAMPEVHTYWQWSYDRESSEDKGITLGNGRDAMPLANFISWLEIYLAGPVNGREGSNIAIQLPSIRALTQFIKQCSPFIDDIPHAIKAAQSALEVRRLWQMPSVPLNVIAEFQELHAQRSQEPKRDYRSVYSQFHSSMQKHLTKQHLGQQEPLRAPIIDSTLDAQITDTLQDYFRFEPKAGTTFLVLQAKKDWQQWKIKEKRPMNSIFETPLFQPLIQSSSTFKLFDKNEDLSEWAEVLEGSLPLSWVANLKGYQTILNYPVPEVGKNTAISWDHQKDIKLTEQADDNQKKIAKLLLELLVENNFYTDAKQTKLLNIGRIFELVIASLNGDVTQDTIHSILTNTPFFSTKSLAPTKTLLLKTEESRDTNDISININISDEDDSYNPVIAKLQEEINTWRVETNVHNLNISPWLVYKVFEKVYRQASTRDRHRRSVRSVRAALNIAAHTFYSTWSAFGSFEKGELFGLPNVIATTTLNDDKLSNFEKHDHFFINLSPFGLLSNSSTESYEHRKFFGTHTKTITYVLGSHPLKRWLDEVISINWHEPKDKQATMPPANKPKRKPKLKAKTKAKDWLSRKLNIEPSRRQTPDVIKDALQNYDVTEQEQIKSEMESLYDEDNRTLKNLNKALKILRDERS